MILNYARVQYVALLFITLWSLSLSSHVATAQAAAEVPTHDSCPLITQDLRRGDAGAGVEELQRFLTKTGDYTYAGITGFYGYETKAAVQRYQLRNNLVLVGSSEETGFGVVGARTRQHIADCVLQLSAAIESLALTSGASQVAGAATSSEEKNYVDIRDYGAVKDNAAYKVQNRVALEKALATGRSVFIPRGTFYVEVLSSGFSPAAGTGIFGASTRKSILHFISETTQSKSVFKVNKNDVRIANLSIEYEGPENEMANIIKLEANNFTLKETHIDGGNTAEFPNQVNVFFTADVDTDNLQILNNELSNVQRVMLRTNLAKGLMSNVLIQGNYIHDLGRGGIQFNTPTRPAENIKILNNQFYRFHTDTDRRLFIGFAGGRNILIANNEFSGVSDNCIHFEEDVKDVVVRNNSCHATNIGLFLQDNNVSDEDNPKQPRDILIEKNTFINTLPERTGDGINAVYNDSGMTAFENITVRNNLFSGFENALNLDDSTYAVQGNVIHNCGIGIRLRGKNNQTIKNNLFNDCKNEIVELNR